MTTLETLRQARDLFVEYAIDRAAAGYHANDLCTICGEAWTPPAADKHTPDCIISRLDREIAAPVGNVAQMRAALEPFAKAASLMDETRDEIILAGPANSRAVRASHLRAARDALAAAPLPTTPAEGGREDKGTHTQVDPLGRRAALED